MKDLQIPTRPIAVEVFTEPGRPLRGFLFHTDTPFDSDVSHDVAEVLNDERAFVPFSFEEAGGVPMILNKDHVVRVRVEALAADSSGESPPIDWNEQPRTLVLADGTRVSGQIEVDTPPHAARLVDKLNLAPPFVAVRTVAGLEFVRRTSIARVE